MLQRSPSDGGQPLGSPRKSEQAGSRAWSPTSGSTVPEAAPAAPAPCFGAAPSAPLAPAQGSPAPGCGSTRTPRANWA